MAADIRIARRKGAGKMGLPEVSLGVLPGTGGTQRLARLVGKSKAIELMATGQLFDFERGLELGLLNQIFDTETAEQFSQQVTEYAAQFTLPNKASGAVGRIKRSVQTGGEIPFRDRRWRWSASYNNNSFNRKMPKKVLTLTSISASQSLKVNSEW